jgi:outer membrane receptor for monomeric catechols
MPSLGVSGCYLFTHRAVESATDPSLEGKLLPQTPENVFTVRVSWNIIPRCTLTTQARYTDRQFEDDQNTRLLRSFTTLDAAILYRFSNKFSTAIKVENLLDQEIESGKSADGIVSIAAPRLVTVQLRCEL